MVIITLSGFQMIWMDHITKEVRETVSDLGLADHTTIVYGPVYTVEVKNGRPAPFVTVMSDVRTDLELVAGALHEDYGFTVVKMTTEGYLEGDPGRWVNQEGR